MKVNPEELDQKSPKQLRTLRNHINNRISAMEIGKDVPLKPSHPLFGLELDDCQNLLIMVKKLLKDKR